MFFIPFNLPPYFKGAKPVEVQESKEVEESNEETLEVEESKEEPLAVEEPLEDDELVAIEQNKELEPEDYTEIVNIEEEPFTPIQKEQAVRPPTPAFVEIKKSQSDDTCCKCTVQ